MVSSLSGPADVLRERLMNVSASDAWLFGHHNGNMMGQTWIDCASGSTKCTDYGGRHSDVKTVSGKYPGVLAFDMAWVTLDPNGTNFTIPVKVALDAGAVVSLDFHVNNPVTGGNPQSHGGNPIVEILPGGSANGVWKTWLGHVADLVHQFPQDAFLFRPFHECTLSGATAWWWASGAGVSPSQYRAAYNYTRWVMINEFNVGNVLFTYAPSKPGNVPVAYPVGSVTPDQSYYPGDSVIDVVGGDIYDSDEKFADTMLATCTVVTTFAAARGKIPALCEVGIRKGLTMSKLNTFFTEAYLQTILNSPHCRRLAYGLTWDNGLFYRPKAKTYASGLLHYWTPLQPELQTDDFIAFTASPHTLMAGDMI